MLALATAVALGAVHLRRAFAEPSAAGAALQGHRLAAWAALGAAAFACVTTPLLLAAVDSSAVEELAIAAAAAALLSLPLAGWAGWRSRRLGDPAGQGLASLALGVGLLAVALLCGLVALAIWIASHLS